MVAGAHMNRPDQAFYRCHNSECPKRQVIMAHIVDEYAKRNCIQINADIVGRATADQKYRAAKHQLLEAQDAFDGLVTMLTGMESEPAVVERIRTARETRDAAQAEVDRLEPAQTSVLLTTDALWEAATVDERRRMLGATFTSITVGTGRGEARLSFELRV